MIESTRKSAEDAGDEKDTDFGKIADDLRRASVEAEEAAASDIANSLTLQRKARDLEAAASHIEKEAKNRSNLVPFNSNKWAKPGSSRRR